MVQWTPEKENIILNALFEKYQIKATNELCEEIAARVGEGCTAKAVALRIGHFKKSAKENASGNSKPSPATSTPSKNGATKAKPPGSSARGRKTTKKAVAMTPEIFRDQNVVDDYEELPSPSLGRKHAFKADDAAEGNEDAGMHVKAEQTEEDYSLNPGFAGQYDDPFANFEGQI